MISGPLALLARYVRTQARSVALAGSALVTRAVILLVAPWPLKVVIDAVFARGAKSAAITVLPHVVLERNVLLLLVAGAMLLLGLGNALFDYVGSRTLLRAGQRAILALRCDLFAHVQRLSLGFHRRRPVGDLLARMGGDIQTLQTFIMLTGSGVFSHAVTICGMIAVMFAIDWRFALVSLAAMLPLSLVAYTYSRRMKRSLRTSRRREGELWSLVQEVVSGVSVVQAFGREEHEDRRFERQATRSFEAAVEAGELQAQFSPATTVVIAAASAVALWYGSMQVLGGRITAGELLVFLAYLRSLASPVRQMAKGASVFSKAHVATERIAELLAEEPEISSAPGALVPRACAGLIELRDVTLAYDGGAPVLHDVNLRIEPKTTVAFVGATGAGKSSLVSLIPRFHDATRGSVLLDGCNVRDLALSFVRERVALVLQETLVFQGTVWKNIAYGRSGASREQAIVAARAAGVDDILEELHNGYDTIVGERGALLSGGQRQCVAIARAVLRDAPIVILDEPTSGLDIFMERRVTDAIARLTRERTTLVIAHRLPTIVRADRIVVIDRGRIVEHGTHADLLRERGRYFELWSRATDWLAFEEVQG